MNRQEMLLTIASEECAEVHQRCSKAVRFGMDEIQDVQTKTNGERIIDEFNDLVGVLEMIYNCPIERIIDQYKISTKKDKIATYLKYSEELGTLKD